MEEQLTNLRQKWLEYKRKGDTSGMKLTEIRAKILKKDYIKKKTEEDIKEIFDIKP